MSTERHPSWGIALLSRVQSSGSRLFRSPVKAQHFMTLTVREAEVNHSEHGTRVRAAGRIPLVEIGLSATQFAELLTAANVGDGVPCTIMTANGGRVEDPPPEQDEIADAIGAAEKRGLMESVRFAKRALDTLTEELGRAGAIRKKAISDAASDLRVAVMRGSSDLDFWRKEMELKAHDLRVKAQAEVIAAFELIISKTGLEALRNRLEAPKLHALDVDPEDE